MTATLNHAVDCDRFTVLGELGRGSMGIVYRAHDAKLGRDVALKTLPRFDAGSIVGFKDEFRSIRDIQHPNVVELDELVVDDRRCFFTMQLVDGHDIVSAVRGSASPGVFDDVIAMRLRAYLRQLVSGLQAIHRAGKVHRDIKPSNVLVGRDGVLRLLDFGLARRTAPSQLHPEPGVAGTPAYMAPEQLMGAPLTTAVDWYAVGAVIVEAITGVPAYRGPAHRIATQKLSGKPLLDDPPAAGGTGVLFELARALLERDPKRRAGRRACLEALGDEATHDRSLELVGRAAELKELHRVAETHRVGIGGFVHVHGVSGIGKSALLERFCDGRVDRGTLVLRSRCHPSESVAYNALDGIVDDIGRFLELRTRSADTLLPSNEAADLFRLFPVLAKHWPGIEAARGGDPPAARRRGVVALRKLLANLSKIVPVMLWIDDVQWADADSDATLRQLVQRPGAPMMLVVLSYRSEDRGSSPFLKRLGEYPLSTGSDYDRLDIALDPLAPDDARTLAGWHLRRHGTRCQPETLDRLVAEASGSPFFIEELSRLVEVGEMTRGVTVDGAVEMRLARLPADSRTILEFVALAASPLNHTLLLSAAGRSRGDAPLRSMERSHLMRRLVRAEHGSDEDVSVVFHDRIREAVVRSIDPLRCVEVHRALAVALEESEDPDLDALVVHFGGAGVREKQAEYAIKAGVSADESLAFARAAELYAIALSYHRDVGSLESSLLSRHASAAANAGRGAIACESYEEAAARAKAEGAPETAVLDLKRLAAMELTRASGLDAGLPAQMQVLRSLGLRVPRLEGTALLAATLRRRRLRRRGYDFVERPPEEVDAGERVRLDALWGAATSLGVQNFALADDLATRHLSIALESGDRSRITRALVQEATYEAHMHRGANAKRARETVALVTSLLRDVDAPYDHAWNAMGNAMIHWAFGEWRLSARHGRRAQQLYQEHCPGSVWETGLTRLYFFSSLAFCGELAELAPQLDDALADARSRGDEHAADHYRVGHMSTVRLAHGRVGEADKLLAEAEARMPRKKMNSHRYHCFVLAVQAELYRGDAVAAWSRVQNAWRDVALYYFLQPTPWVELLHLRARAAIALAAALESGEARPATRTIGRLRPASLLRLAERTASAIRKKYSLPVSAPFSASLRAAIARLRGDARRAAQELRDASEGFRSAGMRLHEEAARIRLVELDGTTVEPPIAVGASEEAAEWMRLQGVVDPSRTSEMLLPGISSL